MPARGLVMLQRRPEFLRIRGGLRSSCDAFVVEAKSRDGWISPTPVPAEIARFGLTVTKQHGSAVVRNRTRRRLKAALRELAPSLAKPGFDYVVIARANLKEIRFDRLLAELTAALERVHSARQPRPKAAPRAKPADNSSRT
ncbi:MAG: ribonuclease P protein component [Hyphomicrobiaceae bacterium]